MQYGSFSGPPTVRITTIPLTVHGYQYRGPLSCLRQFAGKQEVIYNADQTNALDTLFPHQAECDSSFEAWVYLGMRKVTRGSREGYLHSSSNCFRCLLWRFSPCFGIFREHLENPISSGNGWSAHYTATPCRYGNGRGTPGWPRRNSSCYCGWITEPTFTGPRRAMFLNMA